jgi:lipopolysaccharide export LptBFGC system permease protein LptF
MRTSKKIIECRHYLRKIIDKYDDIKNDEYQLEDYEDFLNEHPKEHKKEKDDVEKIKYKSYLYWFYVALFLFIFFIFLAILLRYLSNREVVVVEQQKNVYVPIEAPPAVVKGGNGRRFRK